MEILINSLNYKTLSIINLIKLYNLYISLYFIFDKSKLDKS